MHKPTILYIVGLGHSGSTLLDLLLGSHTQAVGLGELGVLSSRSSEGSRELALREQPCTCGTPSRLDCPFWGGVDRWLHEEHGTSLMKIALDAPLRSDRVAANRALYSTISELTGRRYLVDSSKSRSRLRSLIEAQFDVRPIHLVREPHGVVYSNVRKGRSWLHYSGHYASSTLKTHRLLAARPHLLVRYEELAAEPEAVVRRIVEWVGLEFEPGQLCWTEFEHHQLSGNRMRFSGDPSIRLDRSWQEGLSRSQRIAISAFTLPSRVIVRAPRRGNVHT